MVRDVLLGSDTRAVIIETYGAGNAPSKEWFLDLVRQASQEGKILVNVTQCLAGEVNLDLYATGHNMKMCGVVSGNTSTTEAMLAKLFYLLGTGMDNARIKAQLALPLRGEIL